MLINFIALAAAVAQAAATVPATVVPSAAVAVPGRGLRDLPDTTISYYDIGGKTGPAIEKSLKAMLENPATKNNVRLFSWDVGTQIVKATTGTKCVVKSAKVTLTSKVNLPRLAEQAKVRKDVMANWTTYIANVEGDAAANLWFIRDRMRGAEQSLVGMPCDAAGPAWNAKIDTVKSDLAAFIAKRALPIAKPAA